MSDFEELIFADTAAMLAADEFAEDIVYRRPSAGKEEPIRGITEIGDFSRMKDIRNQGQIQRFTGRLYVADTALAEFGNAAEYRDEVDIKGVTWTVLNTVSEDYGLLELAIECNVRPVF